MKTNSILSFILFITSSLAIANVDQRNLEFNDKEYEYNCALTIADSAGHEILAYKLHRTSYNVASVSVNPPGNATEIVVEESGRAGIVNTYALAAPYNTFYQKKKPIQAEMQIYRREGQIENSDVGGDAIIYIEKDTLIGSRLVKGTGLVTKKIDKYEMKLECVQNSKKK